MRAVPALLLLLLAACNGPGVQHASGDVTVSTDALALPDTYVGFPSRASLTVTNTSASSRTVALAATAPFAVGVEALTIPAATDLELTVTFSADAEGPAAGHLTLSAEGVTFDVALSALARATPPCPPAGPCVGSTFDPATGTCVQAQLPDGAACLSGAACFLDSQCLAGQCVGTPRDCADTNPCTADACDPQAGCTHSDISASCPAPSDPCHAALCDPVTGCGVTEVVDGTSCGDADCITAHICLSGVCQVAQVPDGASCGSASPCQAPGVCRAHVCEQTDAGQLVPVWTYTPTTSAGLRFNGLADLQGNLYWTESDFTKCSSPNCPGFDLVSATVDGVIRYRAPIGGDPLTDPIIADGLVVVGYGSQLVALRTGDGSLAWQLNLLSTPLANLPLIPPSWGHALRVVEDGHGGLVLLARFGWVPGTSTADALLAVDTATGTLRWWRGFDGYELTGGLATDEVGRTWLSARVTLDGGVADALLGVSTAGVELTRTNAPGTGALAVADGRLALPSNTVGLDFRSTADAGSTLAVEMPWWVQADEPVVTSAGAWLVSATGVCCPTCPCPVTQQGYALSGYTPPVSQAFWSVSLSSSFPGDPSFGVSALALAANGDLLYARSPNRYQSSVQPATLEAISSSGAPRFSCELPSSTFAGSATEYTGPTVLGNGRWVIARLEECFVCDLVVDPYASIVAFDVPGYALGPHGWTTARGNSQRSGRPR